ncbi:MAG: Holliday junction resolvase RuvX [Bacillota bacterium]|jgi:putative Holliday junction resolvase
MRLMGLDIGSRTIGVAVSDPMGWTAQGITTIRRKSLEYDLIELEKIINDYNVEAFVLGLPLNMNGSSGEAVEKIKAMAVELTGKFGLPVYYQDERLSTVSAHRALIEGDVSRKGRKKVVDKLAAVFILQTYLDNPKNVK